MGALPLVLAGLETRFDTGFRMRPYGGHLNFTHSFDENDYG